MIFMGSETSFPDVVAPRRATLSCSCALREDRVRLVGRNCRRFHRCDIYSVDSIEVMMPTQTVTRVVEADIEPERLYHFLAEASNIPKWAPVFADSIERVSDAQHRVTKNGEPFSIEILLHPSAYAVDYVRQMSGGRRGGAYIRVTPRPLGGS